MSLASIPPARTTVKAGHRAKAASCKDAQAMSHSHDAESRSEASTPPRVPTPTGLEMNPTDSKDELPNACRPSMSAESTCDRRALKPVDRPQPRPCKGTAKSSRILIATDSTSSAPATHVERHPLVQTSYGSFTREEIEHHRQLKARMDMRWKAQAERKARDPSGIYLPTRPWGVERKRGTGGAFRGREREAVKPVQHPGASQAPAAAVAKPVLRVVKEAPPKPASAVRKSCMYSVLEVEKTWLEELPDMELRMRIDTLRHALDAIDRVEALRGSRGERSVERLVGVEQRAELEAQVQVLEEEAGWRAGVQ